MKRTVYLDTTIPSYLFDRRESIKSYIDVTKKWWKEERPNYHVVVSSETVAEASRGNHTYKEDIVSCIAELDLLPNDKQVDQIVQVYIDNQLMPRSLTGDGLHLAYASLYKVDFLLTWNCNHLANANKKRHIKTINTRLDLFTPEIITPLELFTETDTETES